jgi:hypothetical protein
MGIYEGAQKKLVGCVAGSGLTATTVQYRFVKISADNTVVLCAATTDVPCGVIQAPVAATGDPVEVVYEGQTLLQADTSITISGATGLIGTSGDGQATVAVATMYVAGQAISIAGATTAGTLIGALISCGSPTVL